jgi:hypothetical protein
MTENEFVTMWQERITLGKEYRRKYSTYARWPDFRNMYRNKWDKAAAPNPINKVFSYGRMLIPRVCFNAPRVTLTAAHPDLVTHAKVVEAIDNLLIKECFLKNTMKGGSLDSFLNGVGPIKLGYDSEFGFMPEQAMSGETLTQVDTKDGSVIEYNAGIKPGMPWATRVDPIDIIVPWGAKDPENLEWVAHRIIRTLEDVKHDQKYHKAAVEKLKGLSGRSDADMIELASKPMTEKDKAAKFCTIWEIRDYKHKEIICICEDQLLMQQKDALQFEGLPYEFIMFNPDPDYFWAIPDVDILEPQQLELNDTAHQLKRHRGVALLKFLYEKGKIDKEELEKMLSGEVGVAVGVEDLVSSVTTLQPHIPPDLYNALMATANAMRESIGFSSAEQYGNYQGTPKTASEVMTVTQDIDQRIAERRQHVAEVFTNIIRKWNQMIFSFWTEERVINIVGPMGQEQWFRYTGDQLKAEYFINVEPDSGMPITKTLKYQLGKDMMGTFGGDPLIDQVLLRQIMLDNYRDIDPRTERLLSMPMGMDPRILAAARQASPLGASTGGGKGSAGGRQGSSPQRGNEFNSAQKRFQQEK